MTKYMTGSQKYTLRRGLSCTLYVLQELSIVYENKGGRCLLSQMCESERHSRARLL